MKEYNQRKQNKLNYIKYIIIENMLMYFITDLEIKILLRSHLFLNIYI